MLWGEKYKRLWLEQAGLFEAPGDTAHVLKKIPGFRRALVLFRGTLFEDEEKDEGGEGAEAGKSPRNGYRNTGSVK